MLILVVVGGATFLLYSLAKLVLSFNNPKSRLPRIISELSLVTEPLVSSLVEIEENDLRELAYKVTSAKSSRGLNPIKSGVIHSIYGENFMVYALKTFKSRNVHVLMVKSLKDEFLFYIEQNQTDIYINGVVKGMQDIDGNVYDPSGSSIIISLAIQEALSSYPISVEDKVVADVNTYGSVAKASPRVFSSLSPGDADQQNLVVATVITPSFLPLFLE